MSCGVRRRAALAAMKTAALWCGNSLLVLAAMPVTLSLLGSGLRGTIMGLLPVDDVRRILNRPGGDDPGPGSRGLWASTMEVPSLYGLGCI